jgi:hypothetical protein
MAQSTALARYATAEVAKDAAVARASSAVRCYERGMARSVARIPRPRPRAGGEMRVESD